MSSAPRHAEIAQRLEQVCQQLPKLQEQLLAAEQVAASLPLVWESSEYVARCCTREPQLLSDLIESECLLRAQVDMATALHGYAGQAAEAELPALLRHFRMRQTVRIAWRDIAGWASLAATLGELSTLADVCIQFAYERMYQLLCERYGTPRGASGAAQPLLVLGMGKLGGRELNFSSDIDLVLLYPEEGETDGARQIDNAEFFLRLTQKMVPLLANNTPEGFVYRVDLRLRPFGESGRVALGFGAFENYLQQHGRDWERYAYVKARAITAHEHFPELYEQVLRPFVYRRYLDFGVFESLRAMKAMIQREVERRELEDDIKLGPGGIREVEFIVQAFQLLRGGGDRRLQKTELQRVLPLLVGQRLLRQKTVEELQAAYVFLRRVENRLQQWNDEQTHRLPSDAAARERLARSLQLADAHELQRQLQHHRGNVMTHFAQAVFGPASQSVEVLDLDAAPAIWEPLLGGFAEPQPIAQLLSQLGDSVYYRRLDETGRRRLCELLPRLLSTLSQRPDAALTLSRLLQILEMIGGRTVYLALLNENATALRRLIELCAASQFLADQVASHPLLLDELVDERLIETPPSREQFVAELSLRHELIQVEDPERQIEILLQFQLAALFRVAVADLTGALPLMKVSDRLTDIAELIVQAALNLAWAQIGARHGLPYCESPGKPRRQAIMIVVGYGKLGGLELGYGSDLDLVLLHDSEGEVERTDGPQPIDNTLFFQRLGQRLVHLLTTHTSAGRLYEVDTRLRPAGNRGLLVQSLQSFTQYEFSEAWTWEHQSLLRARAIVGGEAQCAAFEAARIAVLRKAVRRADLKQEVRNMRSRMRENLSRAKPGQFDMKQDAGGIADLEFLVQYWVLSWADRYPEIIMFSDNIRQLESLASGNLVPQSRVDFLVNTYRRYRERMHHLSLNGGGNVVPDTEFVAERQALVAIWEEVMGEGEVPGPAQQSLK
jgi:[glutamine synthetase] adenylyltransferase / [glutamine synthetase]-adenylyl-L-tyrosine phosphorylase